MSVRLLIQQARLEDLADMRAAYLNGLLEAQEALLEVQIPSAAAYSLVVRGRRAGYALIARDTLLEFWIAPEFLPQSHLIFRKLVAEKAIVRALVKSFDHLLMACAMDIQVETKVLGILVRELVKRDLPQLPGVRFTQRGAVETDAPRLLAVDGNVFNHPERMAAAIRAERVRVFEQGDRLVGFGMLKPVLPGRPHVDIGLVIDKPFRLRGYAAYALRDLADYCLAQGLEPISGCSADNLASINLGLRVGFVSRYRLLELSFGCMPAVV